MPPWAVKKNLKLPGNGSAGGWAGSRPKSAGRARRGRFGAFEAAVNTVTAATALYILLLLVSLAPYLKQTVLVESLKDREIWFAVVLSMKTSLCSACLAVLLGVPVAYALSRKRFLGWTVVDTLLDLPTVISPVALGAILLIFFQRAPGSWVQEYLVRVVFTPAGIVVAQTTIALAVAVRMIKAVFDSVDPGYELAACILGESNLGAFWRVTLPMARHGIFSAFVLAWARALGEFGATVTLAGATRFKTETLPVAIYLSLASVNLEKTVMLTCVLIALSFFFLLGVRSLSLRKGWDY